jgi:TrpR-related protein YerC/YecD
MSAPAPQRAAPTRPASAARLPEPPDAWRTPAVDDLADALLAMRTRDEMTALLRDVCSLHELEVLAHRWQAARLLDQGIPYARVAQEVNGSTATVTRVAHWLRHGQGGYRLALARLARRGRR